MNTRFLVLLTGLLLAACGRGGDQPEPPVVACTADDQRASAPARAEAGADSPGLPERIDPTTLRFSADTGSLDDVVLADAFPELRFDGRPVDFERVPGTGQNVVVEHQGRVLVFENRPEVSAASVFLDLRDRVDYDANEQGLVRIAFDPDYHQNGYAYVTYAGRADAIGARCEGRCSVVSRFTRVGGGALRLDRASEQIILVLPQPEGVHNVGNLLFGPDGYLYVGVGDGGFSWPPSVRAQDRTNLYGTVLRIDVSELPYRIPPDNPFVGAGLERAGVIGAGRPVREEIWAYGLRNPHRFSFDPVTRELWLADVGQAEREEVNLIDPGGNYGWPAFEGTRDHQRTDIGRDPEQYLPPLLEYGHGEGTSITGGHVYRGAGIPGLYGRYVFGDFVAGKIWSVARTDGGGLGAKTLLTDQAGSLGIAAFSLVDDELHVVNLGRNTIQRLQANVGNCGDEDCSPVPGRLSQTGIFADLSTLQTQPGLIPFEVNAPLWSDDSVKRRWLALPAQTTIEFDETGAWRFPLGTVLVKHFEMDLDETIGCMRKLETRVLVHTRNGWIGYTYKWNDEQTDAELLSGRRSDTLEIVSETGVRRQVYDYPSTSDCAVCHTASAGFVLGARTAQLNRDFDYPAATDNQLHAMDHIALFDGELQAAQTYARYPSLDDDTASPQQRARAYLSTNCAQCHNPDHANPADIDLRYGEDDDTLNAVGVDPRTSDMGVQGSQIIFPGDRTRSTLWLRMNLRGRGQMPPLATHAVDERAVALIGDWIDSMAPAAGNSAMSR